MGQSATRWIWSRASSVEEKTHRATQGVRHHVEMAVLTPKLHYPAGGDDVMHDLRLPESVLLVKRTQFADCHDILL